MQNYYHASRQSDMSTTWLTPRAIIQVTITTSFTSGFMGLSVSKIRVHAGSFPAPCLCGLSRHSRVRLFATPGTIAHQAPLPVGSSRQAYWSGLPCPSAGELPDPGIEPASPGSPALAGGFFTTSASWKPSVPFSHVLNNSKCGAHPHGHLLPPHPARWPPSSVLPGHSLSLSFHCLLWPW